MNTRFLLLAFAAAHCFTGSLSAQSSDDGGGLGNILRGLAKGLIQGQGGKVDPIRPPKGYPQKAGGYYGPRVFNVVDPQGNEGAIDQGRVFNIVGEGFGDREGQVALLPDGSDQWVNVRSRSIQRWSDDMITVVITDAYWAGRQTRVAVGVVTAEGRSDAMNGILFRSSGGGSPVRPLPPIPGTRPDYNDRDRDRYDHDDRYRGDAPVNTPWSVAAVEGNVDESPSDTFASGTLNSLGGPVARGAAGSNTRHWAGATIGLLTIGTPSSPPWHHFVIGIAGGSPNAARLATSVASAGARGYELRNGPGYPPPGGFPQLAVSGERLTKDQQVTDALPEAQACDLDARLMREALRVALPEQVGRLNIGSLDELGRSQFRDTRSVVKSLSGEGRHMTVLVFLARTDEPYRRRDGRMDKRSARSIRVAVLGNGPYSHEQCSGVFDGRR